MSHPCERYNQVTLKILKKVRPKIGFIERMARSKKNYKFKIPRQDQCRNYFNVVIFFLYKLLSLGVSKSASA